MIIRFSILCTIILIGCNFSENKEPINPQIKLEDITSRIDTSEGFSDVFLKITNNIKTATSHIYIAKGLYKGKTVGLQIELMSSIPYGITHDGEVNSKSGFVKNGIKFSSIGEESDRLLNALGNLYNVQFSKPFSKNKIPATVFSLNQQEANLNKSNYYQFKIFFKEDGGEEDYAELYFNINTGERVIELHEKDPEYRKPLLKALSE